MLLRISFIRLFVFQFLLFVQATPALSGGINSTDESFYDLVFQVMINSSNDEKQIPLNALRLKFQGENFSDECITSDCQGCRITVKDSERNKMSMALQVEIFYGETLLEAQHLKIRLGRASEHILLIREEGVSSAIREQIICATDLSSQDSELGFQLSKLRRDNSRLQERLDSISRAYQILKGVSETTTKENSSLRKQLKEIERTLNQATRTIRTLEQQLEESEWQNDQLNMEVRHLRNGLRDSAEKMSGAKAKIDTLFDLLLSFFAEALSPKKFEWNPFEDRTKKAQTLSETTFVELVFESDAQSIKKLPEGYEMIVQFAFIEEEQAAFGTIVQKLFFDDRKHKVKPVLRNTIYDPFELVKDRTDIRKVIAVLKLRIEEREIRLHSSTYKIDPITGRFRRERIE